MELAAEYLNVRDTARLLDVHENTIRNWARNGTLRSSKLPGSRGHRFERAEVERLLARRGESVSPVAPLLRTDSPELAGPADLAAWAATRDAQGGLPELISRLLSSTPGITSLEMRSGDGVAAGGWDGTATSGGATVLPAGELRFELSVEARPKGKADADYAKRVEALKGATSPASFIFVTARNWPSGQAWADGKRAEQQFRDVRVLDAHSIYRWLQATPSVHYWFSELLGRMPRDVRTLEAWRSETLGRLKVTLLPEFFAAGREREVETLRSRLGLPEPLVLSIGAGARAEAIAFVHAAAHGQKHLIGRSIVIKSADAWGRVLEADEPLILIAAFEDADVRSAIDRGHSVILPGSARGFIGQVDIQLPKIDPHEAAAALRAANRERHDEYRIVALARRSFPALMRTEAPDHRTTGASWASDSAVATALARLALAGIWTERASDREVLCALVGRAEEEIEQALTHTEPLEDAPFTRSAGIWRITSPVEVGLWMYHRLNDQDRTRWLETVATVLLDPDPYEGMDESERLAAQASGVRPKFSEALSSALAEQMALLATLSDLSSATMPTEEWPKLAAISLLRDADAERWVRLSRVLPNISEAAPDVFLEAVELDLSKPAPAIAMMFRDTERGMFGTSSPHTGLLWALEGLCWSADYFARAARALAALCAVDPGGTLMNRPFESLKGVTLGWIRHSGAAASEKLALVAELEKSNPDLAWRLVMALWPDNHQTAFEPHTPSFRDWRPSDKGVPWTEWHDFVEGILALATKGTASRADRWADLIRKVAAVPASQRGRLHQAFVDADRSGWTSEDRFMVWKSVMDEMDRHEEYSDAKWAIPSDEVEAWRRAVEEIGHGGDLRRFAPLFTWRPTLSGLAHDTPQYEGELRRQRTAAFEEIANAPIGEVRRLVDTVENPWGFGCALADESVARDGEYLEWLGESSEPHAQVAMAIATTRSLAEGVDWAKSVLESAVVHSEVARQRLARALPPKKSTWSRVAELGDEFQDWYWRGLSGYRVDDAEQDEAARELIARDLPWSAVTVLANQLHASKLVDSALATEVLQAAAASHSQIADQTMAAHHVENLLEFLESTGTDTLSLARLEFTFFEFIHDHHPNAALYKVLCDDHSEFCDLVSAVYRADGEAPSTPSEAQRNFGRLAHSVLREWPRVPGRADDGQIDEAHLGEWVEQSRAVFAETGRTAIGDEVIGGILSSGPTGDDGIWPEEAIRNMIETLKSTHLESGLYLGVYNRRGVTTRGVFDGGDQERQLEGRYRAMAVAAQAKWPRTASLLRSLADSFGREARHHDQDAERLGDQV